MTNFMFAYGSNLCKPRLFSRISEVKFVAVGKLRGYSYRWHKTSDDGSGKGDAFATGNPEDVVWGAIFDCSSTSLAILDEIEGVGFGYERIEVPIDIGDETLFAGAYIAVPDATDPDLKPYDWYKSIVLLGAISLQFPSTYIAELNGIEAIPDPDRERWHLNMKVLAESQSSQFPENTGGPFLNLQQFMNRKPVPRPWAEADNIPWHDPKFSKRMLKEHLCQDHDRSSRRFSLIDKHVDWIHRSLLNGQPGHILDLGCGPGFYAVRLAELGHTVVGIDYSPSSMLETRRDVVNQFP